MRLTPLAFLLAGSLLSSGGPDALRVLRVTPNGEVGPAGVITVTFDRPVAGSLDHTVDPRAILSTAPAVPGRLEWRDPVTIRLTPVRPLTPGARYTVVVANGFSAMDGSRLAEPHVFSFRVRPPSLVGTSVSRGDERAQYLTAKSPFAAAYTSPVDLARLSAAAYLEFGPTCAGDRIVRLRATAQRPLTADDPWQYRQSTGDEGEGSGAAADSLRRLVTLVPERPLPMACAGELVVPQALDAERGTTLARLGFATHGPLALRTVDCADRRFCPTGPLQVTFTTPVKGAEVLRRVRIIPAASFTVRDTASESATWTLESALRPRTAHAVVVDTALRDVFGQRFTGNPAGAFLTTGYAPSIEYAHGRLLVERRGYRTLAVQHVNVPTLVVAVAPVPRALEGAFLSRGQWSWGELWEELAPSAAVSRLPVRARPDVPSFTGVPLPAPDARRPGAPTLYAVRVMQPGDDIAARNGAPVALVQTSDLGVHAKIGLEQGAVWVTGASDGLARAGADVALFTADGRQVASARTDARGLAMLTRRVPARAAGEQEASSSDSDGYVAVSLADDRAVAAVSQYDPDLSPWRFNVASAWGDTRAPIAGAVFTERGIYRPGEELFAKAIVRVGALGALRAPARGDSLRWLFADRDEGTLQDTVVALSAFGTASHSLRIPAGAPLGQYDVRVQARREGTWRTIGSASYRVAEYRPPEFLVDVAPAEGRRMPGDSLAALVQARYLFGAPMGRAAVTWQARRAAVPAWELDIPGTDGFFVGESGWWWEDAEGGSEVEVFAGGTDTLDAAGQRTLRAVLPTPARGRAARVTLSATVTDVNRQSVGAGTSVLVHPAAFYIAAKPLGSSYFWTAGAPQAVGAVTVRPDGARVPGVAITGTVVRREWHQVRRERGGVSELVGEWVADTVARCALTSAAEPVPCRFTPPAGGTYVVSFTAADARGRRASTTFYRWASGKEWVPWNDESQFKMDVIPDRTRYSVGDTATVLLASPFTGAEAWVTVEREGVIEQQRLRLASGSTALKLPITEAYVPNAYVSVIVARGRSAPPGRLDDPGRPTIRVGYAELRVTPAVKRLAVAVRPLAPEYRPGDSAQIRVQVRDAAGRGARGEVTLWAVDEGVLSLTGFKTPDPVDLVYRPRGLGLRLASNLAAVAPQVPEGEKGRREPGGGGGASDADVLRSRFKTTAFFLGSVITDAGGDAIAGVRLPDNVTTFRVMAVAVTDGDRYGSGDAPLLVTRPLVARPALPRFARAGDEFHAGAVVNRRDATAAPVRVDASARGVELRGARTQDARLEAGRGREVRFPFRAADGDSIRFRFDVASGADADAVEARIPVRPAHHPRAHTVAGMLRDSSTVDIALPADVDPSRSDLTLSFGSSPLAVIRGLHDDLRVYPYACTEQIGSMALPLIALYRAQRTLGTPLLAGNPQRDVATAVRVLSGRQRADGGIGLWSATDWTSPWLTAHAGQVLLDARAAGVAVDDSVLARLAGHLSRALHDATPAVIPVADFRASHGAWLRERVAAVDLLSRMGRSDRAAENELLRLAAQLGWEDRVRLAEVLARRGATDDARRLLAPAWAEVRVEGARAVLPDSVGRDFYFASSVRPVARLLTATLAADAQHPLVGPLVESLAHQGRSSGGWRWNTQDRSSAVGALAEFERRQRAAPPREVRVRTGGRTLLAGTARGAPRDSTAPLAGLLADGADGGKLLRLRLDAPAPGAPVYYYLTVREVPRTRPVTPSEAGIKVERWYEAYDTGRPTVSVAEGELVRVRLRVTVPASRNFLVLDDALPAGLEAVDLSLRTASPLPGIGGGYGGAARDDEGEADEEEDMAEGDVDDERWAFGSWDAGWWSPFDHRELRDDRVVYVASVLWKGTYTATYVARATTPGVFVRPPAHAEEMYNPAVNGRSDGGLFTVTVRKR